MSSCLSDAKIEQALAAVPLWRREDREIVRTFQFANFVESVEFVNEVTELAEEADHHPDVDIRWNKVTLHLTTHSKGGLTAKDFELAQRIDALV